MLWWNLKVCWWVVSEWWVYPSIHLSLFPSLYVRSTKEDGWVLSWVDFVQDQNKSVVIRFTTRIFQLNLWCLGVGWKAVSRVGKMEVKNWYFSLLTSEFLHLRDKKVIRRHKIWIRWLKYFLFDCLLTFFKFWKAREHHCELLLRFEEQTLRILELPKSSSERQELFIIKWWIDA